MKLLRCEEERKDIVLYRSELQQQEHDHALERQTAGITREKEQRINLLKAIFEERRHCLTLFKEQQKTL